MLNGQQRNDYTAIAPTSLLVAGVYEVWPLDAGNRQLSEIGILSNSISNAVVFKSANGCVCDAKDEGFHDHASNKSAARSIGLKT
jgi:hypothetical protein